MRFLLKKYFKYKITTIVIVGIILLITFVGIFVLIREEKMYSSGRDTYKSFGDGRFQILRSSVDDNKSLFDSKISSTAIINDVEKYIKKRNYLYISGFFSSGKTFHSNKWLPSRAYYDLKTGERKYYKTIEEIPRYTILNYYTGEIKLYKTLKEVPKKDREIFEKKLVWWCKFRRTCYEKENGEDEK